MTLPIQDRSVSDQQHLVIEPSGRPAAKRLKLRAVPFLMPISVFLIALALRAVYNCYLLEHRICHFGDAYNFLRTGAGLLEAAYAGHGLSGFLSSLVQQQSTAPLSLQSMASMRLTDRLLIDGPVYPAYLAMIEWLSGIDPRQPIFESRCLQLCLCNSFIDALTCVLIYWIGRLAFNRWTGLIAGLGFALYPPAIINTQHCYSEPFAYFLLSVWMSLIFLALLRHRPGGSRRLALWLAIGVASGMLMLAKPAFVMLPAIMAVLLLSIRRVGGPVRRLAAENAIPPPVPAGRQVARRQFSWPIVCLCLAAGMMLVLGPWALFNRAATGQLSIVVNRVPSFNFFLGNDLTTDGWRTYPYPGSVPVRTADAVKSIIEQAKTNPGEFIGLQLRKVARLWAGIWNEYQYSLLGLSAGWQALWHRLLLVLAIIGFLILSLDTRSRRLSRSFVCGQALAVVILFHFVYLGFESLHRYAMTAMPAVVLLSAYGLALLIQRSTARRLQLILALLVTAWILALLPRTGLLRSFAYGLLPPSVIDWAPWIAAGAGVLGIALVAGVTLFLVASTLPKEKAILAGVGLVPLFLLASAVLVSYTVYAPDRKEWVAQLKGKDQLVRQEIYLADWPRALNLAPLAFVLIDMQSPVVVPEISVTVNGQRLSEPPFPFAQVQPNNEDILQCLAIQGQGMGRDFRTFRQWWAVPVSRQLLNPGGLNTITIAARSGPLKIYGDYREEAAASNRGVELLPSLRSFSWTKGFATFDHRDPRTYESVPVLAKSIHSSRSHGPFWTDKDLSDWPGRQWGAYRIRLAVPAEKAAAARHGPDRAERDRLAAAAAGTAGLPAITIAPAQVPLLVSGSDPRSLVPKESPVCLPARLPSGTRFAFSCELRSMRGPGSALVSLTFNGLESGLPVSWNSVWQPVYIPTATSWRPLSFGDAIPNRVLKLDNLRADLLLSPFQPDLIFLKPKQAAKCRMMVRAASFSLLPPLVMPANRSRQWLIF